MSETSGDFYEVLPEMKAPDHGGSAMIAGFTAGKGIRVEILNGDTDDDYWRTFPLTVEQAELVGSALLRWAKRAK